MANKAVWNYSTIHIQSKLSNDGDRLTQQHDGQSKSDKLGKHHGQPNFSGKYERRKTVSMRLVNKKLWPWRTRWLNRSKCSARFCKYRVWLTLARDSHSDYPEIQSRPISICATWDGPACLCWVWISVLLNFSIITMIERRIADPRTVLTDAIETQEARLRRWTIKLKFNFTDQV